MFHLTVDGDMWREAVWRSSRRLADAGHDDAARALLQRGIETFEWDNTYYSQGRFEYFVGQQLSRQGDVDDAVATWRAAIARYPLTFYSALSCSALTSLGADCAWPQRDGPPFPVLWPLGECLSSTDRWIDLSQAGFFVEAARAIEASGSDCPSALWIQALLLDVAGDVATAHDIPRRQIADWQREVGGELDRRWSIAYPRPFLKQVRLEAERTGVEEALIYAVMREESAFRSGVHSYAGAQGLMQLMPRTARGHAEDVEGEITIERLAQPAVNIRIGANFLAHLGRHMDGDVLLMAASYNAGRGAVRRWLERNPLEDPGLWIEAVSSTQTRNYSKRVLGSLEVYLYLYY
jgi:soluble lytic murein transglycosylase